MNASLTFGPLINTDIDYYQAYFIYLFIFFIFIFFLVSYAMLVMHGLWALDEGLDGVYLLAILMISY